MATRHWRDPVLGNRSLPRVGGGNFDQRWPDAGGEVWRVSPHDTLSFGGPLARNDNAAHAAALRTNAAATHGVARSSRRPRTCSSSGRVSALCGMIPGAGLASIACLYAARALPARAPCPLGQVCARLRRGVHPPQRCCRSRSRWAAVALRSAAPQRGDCAPAAAAPVHLSRPRRPGDPRLGALVHMDRARSAAFPAQACDTIRPTVTSARKPITIENVRSRGLLRTIHHVAAMPLSCSDKQAGHCESVAPGWIRTPTTASEALLSLWG